MKWAGGWPQGWGHSCVSKCPAVSLCDYLPFFCALSLGYGTLLCMYLFYSLTFSMAFDALIWNVCFWREAPGAFQMYATRGCDTPSRSSVYETTLPEPLGSYMDRKSFMQAQEIDWWGYTHVSPEWARTVAGGDGRYANLNKRACSSVACRETTKPMSF